MEIRHLVKSVSSHSLAICKSDWLMRSGRDVDVKTDSFKAMRVAPAAKRNSSGALTGTRDVTKTTRSLSQSVHGNLYICSYRRAVLEKMRKLDSKVKPRLSPQPRPTARRGFSRALRG